MTHLIHVFLHNTKLLLQFAQTKRQSVIKTSKLLTHADMPDHFASFFNKKVIDIMSATVIDNEIYNGEKKVESSDLMFMDKGAIKDYFIAITTL